MSAAIDGGSAFPTTRMRHWAELKSVHSQGEPEYYSFPEPGMSLRAYIATQIAAALVQYPPRAAADMAVGRADALIAALNGEDK